MDTQTEPPRIGFIGLLVRGIFYLSVPVILGVAVYTALYKSFMIGADRSATEVLLFEVPPATSLKSVAKQLEEKGLLTYWWSLVILARINGKDKSMAAGEFELNAAMTPQELLEKLVSGSTYKRRVTIREGTTIAEIPPLFEEAGLLKAQELASALENQELINKTGIEANSFEGYLFPDTYLFSRPLTAEEALVTMKKEAEKYWTSDYAKRAEELKMSRHEVLTLASIIEKESGNVIEQPLVSSVFHNRLRIGMRLQSDPTVIYGIQDFNGNITKKDLETPTPYNTYTSNGLPPGPIANPGKSALEAALYPKDSPYLYFVSDGQGAHIFSSNLVDHNRAVYRYQKSRRAN
jgi:UPF0755 protein